jgi:hypothetical protein
VHVHQEGAQTWIGGQAVTCMRGEVRCDPARTLRDHLVVLATDLASGAAWCEHTLGVAPAAGGEHPLMGTHNRLLQLSGPAHPRAYLRSLLSIQ